MCILWNVRDSTVWICISLYIYIAPLDWEGPPPTQNILRHLWKNVVNPKIWLGNGQRMQQSSQKRSQILGLPTKELGRAWCWRCEFRTIHETRNLRSVETVVTDRYPIPSRGKVPSPSQTTASAKEKLAPKYTITAYRLASVPAGGAPQAHKK